MFLVQQPLRPQLWRPLQQLHHGARQLRTGQQLPDDDCEYFNQAPWHPALCCLSDDVIFQEDHRMTHLPLNGTERHTANICRKTVQVS